MIKKMTNDNDELSLSGDVSGTSVLETRQKGLRVHTVPSKWEVTHPRSELRGSAHSSPQALQSSAHVNIYISVCAKPRLGNKQDDWPLQNIAPQLWCWFVPVGSLVNCILYWLRPVDHSEAFYFQCSLRKSMSRRKASCPHCFDLFRGLWLGTYAHHWKHTEKKWNKAKVRVRNCKRC